MLPVEYLIKHKDWAKKTVRDWAKNRFVFPQFYGSVFFQCAPHLWDALEDRDAQGKYKYCLPDGTPLIEHLKGKGVSSLGNCNPKQPPVAGTFEHHCRKAERSMWDDRFVEYTRWKERAYKSYQTLGYFDTLTGFRLQGLFSKNQVLNLPIQGSAFHIELLAVILILEYVRKYKMKTRIIGQIHDSTIASVPPDELQDYLGALHHIITKTIPKRWPWIIVPVEVEAEVCQVGESWAGKKQWVPDSGAWAPKAA
jgi:hypothetical protein